MEENTMLQTINCAIVNKPKPLGKRHAIKLGQAKDLLVYKIVMCGGSFRGQTTFIKKFTTGEFDRRTITATIGAELTVKNVVKDEYRIRLHLLDVAGQEATMKASEQFYQGSHACVIMFDVTYALSLPYCQAWKDDVDRKCTLEGGEPIPCLLLANKVDLVSERKFEKRDMELYAKDRGYIGYMEVSVKEDYNVSESMDFLLDYLMSRENLRIDQPSGRLPSESTSNN